MKTKTIFILLIFYLGFLNSASGQVKEEKGQSPQELYDFHLKQMKSNKTGAWVALGGGVAMIIGGAVKYATDNIWGNSSSGLVIAGIGLSSSLVSIPLFKAAGEHRAKAEIQLQNGAIGFKNKTNYTGISISINF